MADEHVPAEDSILAVLRGAWINVDLRAIAANVRVLRAWLPPHTHLMAVVKADGYGHGALAVAQAAITSGADWVAVATVSEGIRLRQAGTRNPLLILSLIRPEAFEAAIANDLDLTVSTPQALIAADQVAARMGTVARVHLKVDTGMTRVGLPAGEAASLIQLASSLPNVDLIGLASHLASAEEADSTSTLEQLSRFADLTTQALLPPGILRHIANSAATLYLPASHWDLVRPGLMLYGISPDPRRPAPFPLHPAMSVHARILQVRDVPTGTRVGYGGRFETTRPTRLAVLPVGYADGLPRAASGSLSVLVRGELRPLAGTVSMDQCVVDVGDLPVETGEETVLLGSQGNRRVSVEDWAEAAGTVPYEIMCGLGRRLPRNYLR